jgi:MFS family permease
MGLVGWQTAFGAKWNAGSEQLKEHLSLIRTLPLRELFLIAVVPGLVSAVLVVKSVREIRAGGGHAGAGGPPPIFQSFPRAFWQLILANAVFSLGNSSDAFLILRCGEIGLSFGQIILAFALYNTVYAIGSTPLGHLSDRVGRKPVVMAGWTVYALVYGGFAVLGVPLAAWVLMGLYGLYQALSEGVTKAMISDLVRPEQRAGAIGMFYSVSGLGQCAASVLAGALWTVHVGRSGVVVALLVGTVCALAGVVLMGMVPVPHKEGTAVKTAG